MAIPFVGAGTWTSGTGALSVPMPAGVVAGDLLLLAVETANQAPATPSGWTYVYGFGFGTAGGAGGVALYVYKKYAVSSEPAVAVSDSGNHQTAVVIAYRNADINIGYTTGWSEVTETVLRFGTNSATETGVKWVGIAALDLDLSSTATTSGYYMGTSGTVDSLTERVDQTFNSQAGGGLVVVDGDPAGPGQVGQVWATLSAATTYVTLSIIIKEKLTRMYAATGQTITRYPSLNIDQPIAFGLGRFSNPSRNSTDGITWVIDTPNVVASGNNQTAFAEGVFLSVRYNTNLIARSTNGTGWTERTLPSSGTWNTVAYGNGRWIAAQGSANIMATSVDDGLTWSVLANGLSVSGFRAAAYGNGVWVITTTNGSCITSPDGTTWTLRGSVGGQSRASLAFGNGVFVSVTGTSAYYSTDGVSWTSVVLSSGLMNAGYVGFGNGEFIVAGYSYNAEGLKTFAKSKDGITWTTFWAADLSGTSFAPCFGNGRWVLASTNESHVMYSDPGWAVTGTLTDFALPGWFADGSAEASASADLSTASPISASATAAVTATASTLKVGVLFTATASASASASTTFSGDAAAMEGSASVNATATASLTTIQYISATSEVTAAATASLAAAVRFAGSANAVVSAELTERTYLTALSITYRNLPAAIGSQEFGSGGFNTKVGYLNGMFVGVTSDAVFSDGLYWMVIHKSLDGVQWEIIGCRPTGLTSSSTFPGVGYANGTYFVFQNFYNDVPYYSTDLVDWSKTNDAVVAPMTSVAYGNGVYVFGCSPNAGNTTFVTGANLASLTRYMFSPATIASYVDVAFGNGVFASGTATSTDGVTWTAAATPQAGYIKFFSELGYFVLANETTLYKSTNGSIWTTIATFASGQTPRPYTYNGTSKRFFGVPSSVNTLYVSDDLVSWTAVSGTPATSITSAYTIATDGTVFSTSAGVRTAFQLISASAVATATATTLKVGAGFQGLAAAVASTNTALSDLVGPIQAAATASGSLTCTAAFVSSGYRFAPATYNMSAYGDRPIYGNGFYLDARIDAGPTTRIYKSTDAETWTFNNYAGVSFNVDFFESGVFVAFSTSVLYTSTDGVFWNTFGIGATTDISSVAYGNGIYVAVDTGVGRTVTSTDGITQWTANVSPFGGLVGKPASVVFAFGKFYVSSTSASDPIHTTLDGFTSTGTITAPFPNGVLSYANGKMFLTAPTGTDTHLRYFSVSADGATWANYADWGASATGPIDVVGLYGAVKYANGTYFCYGARSDGVLRVLNSQNGIHWFVIETDNVLGAAYGRSGPSVGAGGRVFLRGGDAGNSGFTPKNYASGRGPLASGTLTNSVPAGAVLEASATATAMASATTLVNGVELTAATASTVTVTATLSTQVRFAGATQAVAAAPGGLSTGIVMAGTVGCAAAVTAVLTTRVRFSASAAATTSASAGLSAQALFRAPSTATVNTTAALSAQTRFASGVSASATSAAALTTRTRFAVAVQSYATAAADLSSGILIVGVGQASASVVPTLSFFPSSYYGTAVAEASAELDPRTLFEAAATSVAYAFGTAGYAGSGYQLVVGANPRITYATDGIRATLVPADPRNTLTPAATWSIQPVPD